MQTNLKKTDGYYPIPRNIVNLYKISNLAKNTMYNLTFNDLLTIFLTNQKGELYFNNNQDFLPMQCIPYVDTRLSKVDYGKDSRNPDPPGDPIAYYYVDSYDCTKSRNMFLTLYDGKNFENVEFIISGGGIGRRFVPNTVEYYNENRFSGVGIL